MSLFPQARGLPKREVKGQPFNVDNQNQKFSVPDGMLWHVLGVYVKPNDSSTVEVFLANKDSKKLSKFGGAGAGTAYVGFPENVDNEPHSNILAFENDIVWVYFGTAQTTGTSYITVVYIEYDIKELFRGVKP